MSEQGEVFDKADNGNEETKMEEEEDSGDKVSWTKEDTESAYNVFRTIVQLINPQQSDTARALVEKSQELATMIEQLGNIEEENTQNQTQDVPNS